MCYVPLESQENLLFSAWSKIFGGHLVPEIQAIKDVTVYSLFSYSKITAVNCAKFVCFSLLGIDRKHPKFQHRRVISNVFMALKITLTKFDLEVTKNFRRLAIFKTRENKALCYIPFGSQENFLSSGISFCIY